MGDMSSMDREIKKRQLRRNIVPLPREEALSRYDEEDSEEIVRRAQAQHRKKRLFIR